MGSIYRAEDTRLPGRFCAIKEVQPDPNATVELRLQAQQQFLQEASILARLDHPNLPKVSDFFNQDGRDYLVMDFVNGSTLEDLLVQRGQPIGEAEVREILAEQGAVTVTCEFCHRPYRYDAVDVEQLFAAAGAISPGSPRVN